MPDQSVLVLGNYRQTITVIRSLGRAGYHVLLGKEKSRDYTEFSRYTAAVWQHPVIREDDETFFVALQDYLDKHPHVRLIFPVGERQIVYFIRWRERLPEGVSLVMADRLSVETCFDKASSYALAKRLSVPVAKYRQPRSYAECVAAVEEIGFPCVIKPNDSRAPFFGKKAIILGKRDELEQQLPGWPDADGFLFVQKFISGYRHNCHYLANQGRLLAYFEQRVMRTNRLDYTASGVDGISVPPTEVLRSHVGRLVQELGYTGPGCCQFLVDDRKGEFYFLEINPRLDATCALPFYCGYEFPLLAVELARENAGQVSRMTPPPPDYPVGKRGAWIIGDLEGLLDSFHSREIGVRDAARWLARTLRTAWSANFHLTWSAQDPKPALYMCLPLLRNFASLFKGRSRPESQEE
jgi:predicted ATP-grasp superfamily ATP-dependent carboligase